MKLYDVIRKENNKLENDPKPQTEERLIIAEPKSKKRRRIIFFGLLALVVTIIYISGIYLVRAKIIIKERHIPFNIESVVIDIPHEKESTEGRLSFQTMTVNSEINREIFGSELVDIKGKAKGEVVFLNEYSKTSVTLKSGTKIIGSNGKTYLTQETANIPGYTVDSKSKKTAGASNTVSIIASETGPSSNSTGISFSISGYTGAKKTQLYARSIGSISGGESGMMHTVSDAERPALIESLKTQLSERLKRETRAQIPNNLITYPDLQFISIDSNSLKLEGEGVKFTAKIKGTMISYLIPKSLFESAIAKEVLSDKSYTNISIPNLTSLSVVPESAIPANSQTPPGSISLKISGQGFVIPKASPERIKQSLMGLNRKSFDSVISNFSEIETAKFKMLPFWAPFFPKQERYLKVETL